MLTKNGEWLEFRWFFDEELEQILTILKDDSSPETKVTDTQVRRFRKIVRAFVERREGNVVRVLVNETTEEVIAVLIYSAQKGRLKILRFVIKPKYRHQGLATQIVAGLKLRADLELIVSEKNLAQLKLASKFKFKAQIPTLFKADSNEGFIRMVLPRRIRGRTLVRT